MNIFDANKSADIGMSYAHGATVPLQMWMGTDKESG